MIDQMRPSYGKEEQEAMTVYLASGGWLTEHDQTHRFERMVADYVGAKHCIATTSGTTALFVALRTLGIAEGDEVILPVFTQTASAGAIELTGATPVFVDIDPMTLCIDLVAAEKAITSRTKALMVVDLNGRSPGMVLARIMADRNGLVLIEDAAQALGSCYNGKALGTWGKAGCYSFSSPKVITTGQGGAIVTDDDEVADRARSFKTFGWGSGACGNEFGLNFKFTDLQAVIGIEQMKKLDTRLARKRMMWSMYFDLLQDIEDVRMLPFTVGGVPWFIDILVPDPKALAAHLGQSGIGTRAFYQPLRTGLPSSDYAAAHGLWLPSGSYLSDESVRYVCEAVKEFYQ